MLKEQQKIKLEKSLRNFLYNTTSQNYSTTQQRRLLKIDAALQNEKKMKIGALFMKMKI